jgi:hypothetical protein
MPSVDHPKNGYWLAFVGAIAGAFVGLSGFGFLFVVVGLLTSYRLPLGSGDVALGLALWGQILAVTIGAAVGIAGALAIGKRPVPILTGLLSIPATFIVFVGVYALGQVIDTMDYGWLLIVPPFTVPFLARLTALWLKFGSGSPQYQGGTA